MTGSLASTSPLPMCGDIQDVVRSVLYHFYLKRYDKIPFFFRTTILFPIQILVFVIVTNTGSYLSELMKIPFICMIDMRVFIIYIWICCCFSQLFLDCSDLNIQYQNPCHGLVYYSHIYAWFWLYLDFVHNNKTMCYTGILLTVSSCLSL